MDDIFEILRELKGVKVILGNGFDLHCGLKTSYSDYFAHDKEKNLKIKQFLDNIRKHISDSKQYARGITNYPHLQRLCINGTETIKDLSVWDVFFYAILEKEKGSPNERRWCDIETEIRNSLYASSSSKSTWESVYDILNNKTLPFEDVENNYIISILASLICGRHDRKEFASSNDFYTFLLEELKRFEIDFGKFVSREHLKNNFEETTRLSHRLEDVEGGFAWYSRRTIQSLCNLGNIVSVDTFNYDVPDIIRLQNLVHNINGTTDFPIFGIDSDGLSPMDIRYIFTKTNRRMELSMNTSVIQKDVPFENVIVYGHSLDAADYNYFFPVLDRMEITNFQKSSKIVFAFSIYDKEKEYQIKADLRMAISKLFEAYSIYRGDNEQPNRLLDSLTTQGKILMYEAQIFLNKPLCIIKCNIL